MGGVLILLAVTVSTLLWADLTNAYVWMMLFVTLGFGAIGFLRRLPEAHQALLARAVRPAASCWSRSLIALVGAIAVHFADARARSAPRSPCRSSRTC